MEENQLQEGRGNSLFTFRNLIILLLGFVLGYLIKLQAVQTVTMGYEDYKLSQWQKNVVEDDNAEEVVEVEEISIQDNETDKVTKESDETKDEASIQKDVSVEDNK